MFWCLLFYIINSTNPNRSTLPEVNSRRQAIPPTATGRIRLLCEFHCPHLPVRPPYAAASTGSATTFRARLVCLVAALIGMSATGRSA